MKTSRIFTGNICLGDKVIKENAIIIYYPGRGYIDFDLISDSFLYIVSMTKQFSKYVMGTNYDLNKSYVDYKSIRPFENSCINFINNVSVKELKLLTKKVL